MRKLPRLVFVLLIGTTTAIFCTLLLSPGFLAIDRRPSRKEQMSIKEEKEENRRSVSGIGLSDARQQFARRASLDAHLLGRGFTDEQVKYCTILYRWFNTLPFTGRINFEFSIFISILWERNDNNNNLFYYLRYFNFQIIQICYRFANCSCYLKFLEDFAESPIAKHCGIYFGYVKRVNNATFYSPRVQNLDKTFISDYLFFIYSLGKTWISVILRCISLGREYISPREMVIGAGRESTPSVERRQ